MAVAVSPELSAWTLHKPQCEDIIKRTEETAASESGGGGGSDCGGGSRGEAAAAAAAVCDVVPTKKIKRAEFLLEAHRWAVAGTLPSIRAGRTHMGGGSVAAAEEDESDDSGTSSSSSDEEEIQPVPAQEHSVPAMTQLYSFV